MRRKAPRLLALAPVLLVGGGLTRGAPPLTLYDARVLVENTSIFSDAVKDGSCPTTSDNGVNAGHAFVIVREGCQGYGLISDFIVNLMTGVITDITGRDEIETEHLAKLREHLFALREQALITPSEARCLVGLVSIGQTRGSCRAVHIDRVEDDSIYATLSLPCLGNQDSTIHVVVDRESGDLKDESTGRPYASPEIKSVQETIVRARAPVRLTTEEAKGLVEEPPVIDEILRRGWLKDRRCLEVRTEGMNDADEAWFQVWAGCDQSRDVIRLSASLVNGTLRVIDTGAIIGSAAVKDLAAGAIAAQKSSTEAAIETLRHRCPGGP